MSETLTGAERDAEAVRRVLAGETLDAIGASWGLRDATVLKAILHNVTGSTDGPRGSVDCIIDALWAAKVQAPQWLISSGTVILANGWPSD